MGTILNNIEQQLCKLVYIMEKSSSPIYQILEDMDESEEKTD